MTTTLQIPEHVLAKTLREKLPAETVAALMEHPAIAADLTSILDEPPFAADYVTREVTVLFDDVTVLQWQDGQMKYPCPNLPADYQPELVEWVVDGETAYFSVQGLEVINRLPAVPQLSLEALKPLEEKLCKR